MTKVLGKSLDTYIYLYGSDGVLAYSPDKKPLSFADADKHNGLGENFDGEAVVIIKKGKVQDLLDYDDNGSMADFIEDVGEDSMLDEDAVAVVFFDDYADAVRATRYN